MSLLRGSQYMDDEQIGAALHELVDPQWREQVTVTYSNSHEYPGEFRCEKYRMPPIRDTECLAWVTTRLRVGDNAVLNCETIVPSREHDEQEGYGYRDSIRERVAKNNVLWCNMMKELLVELLAVLAESAETDISVMEIDNDFSWYMARDIAAGSVKASCTDWAAGELYKEYDAEIAKCEIIAGNRETGRRAAWDRMCEKADRNLKILHGQVNAA